MEGKTFQEGMNASSEEASLEEIFELMKVWCKSLKKILSRLSKTKEVFKEGKEDKADYGQSELTQEHIDRMMIEEKVHLFLPNFVP